MVDFSSDLYFIDNTPVYCENSLSKNIYEEKNNGSSFNFQNNKYKKPLKKDYFEENNLNENKPKITSIELKYSPDYYFKFNCNENFERNGNYSPINKSFLNNFSNINTPIKKTFIPCNYCENTEKREEYLYEKNPVKYRNLKRNLSSNLNEKKHKFLEENLKEEKKKNLIFNNENTKKFDNDDKRVFFKKNDNNNNLHDKNFNGHLCDNERTSSQKEKIPNYYNNYNNKLKEYDNNSDEEKILREMEIIGKYTDLIEKNPIKGENVYNKKNLVNEKEEEENYKKPYIKNNNYNNNNNDNNSKNSKKRIPPFKSDLKEIRKIDFNKDKNDKNKILDNISDEKRYLRFLEDENPKAMINFLRVKMGKLKSNLNKSNSSNDNAFKKLSNINLGKNQTFNPNYLNESDNNFNNNNQRNISFSNFNEKEMSKKDNYYNNNDENINESYLKGNFNNYQNESNFNFENNFNNENSVNNSSITNTNKG